MNLFLIRHGKTKYTEAKQYCGSLNPGLSPAGRAELETSEVCAYLLDHPVQTVFVSPMKRAVETAELLFSDQPTLPAFLAEDALREIDFGDFEGRAFAGDLETDPAYQEWLSTNCEGLIPGGDFPEQFRADAAYALASIVDSTLPEDLYGEQTVAVVTHGGVMGAMLAEYTLPRNPWYHWHIPPGGFVVLHTDRAQWTRDETLAITLTGGGVTC